MTFLTRETARNARIFTLTRRQIRGLRPFKYLVYLCPTMDARYYSYTPFTLGARVPGAESHATIHQFGGAIWPGRGRNCRLAGARESSVGRAGSQPVFSQPHPHRAAERYQRVVEVVARVVQHARPAAVVGRAVTAVPVADDEVAARLLEQEEAEIHGSHRGLELLHTVGAHEAAEELAREQRLPGVIHGGRVVAAERELAARLEGLGCGLRNLAHPPLDQIQHGHGEGPDGPLQLARGPHDVDGFSGPDHGDRDDARVDRALVARDDRLERLHHLSGHRHRVDAVVRHGCVRAQATDRDPEVVARGEHRPFL